jgi:hypothetical protein
MRNSSSVRFHLTSSINQQTGTDSQGGTEEETLNERRGAGRRRDDEGLSQARGMVGIYEAGDDKIREREEMNLAGGQGILKIAGRTIVLAVDCFFGVEVVDKEQSKQADEENAQVEKSGFLLKHLSRTKATQIKGKSQRKIGAGEPASAIPMTPSGERSGGKITFKILSGGD